MESRELLKTVRPYAWVVIVAVVLTSLVAAIVSFMAPKTYRATATVLIGANGGAGLTQPTLQPDRAVQTQVQLIGLRPLAQSTAQTLGLQMTPEDLLDKVIVTAVGQTDLIAITVADGSPGRAADIANRMAESYVQSSMDSRRKSLKTAVDEVKTRQDDAHAQMVALGARIAKGRSDELSEELRSVTDVYTTLGKRLEDLRVSEQLEAGVASVASVAVADPEPVSPQPARNIALGAAVGLVFGFGIAFVLGARGSDTGSDPSTSSRRSS